MIAACWLLVASMAFAVDSENSPRAGSEAFAPLSVSVSGPRGREVVTVVGSSVPLDRLLERVAAAVDRELEGLASTMRPDLLTVELRERPLVDVLEICLGAVGLRAEVSPYSIRIRSASMEASSQPRIREAALAQYARGLNAFGDHPDAPGARLSQAEIEESQGNDGAAVEHYHALIETYRTSEAVHVARWRMALALQRMGLWSEASAQLRGLANHVGAELLHAAARREMARCALELGNPVLAQNMLEALDRSHPSTDREERAERALLVARSRLAQEEPILALQAVEGAAARGFSPKQEMDAMRLRAMAFEKLGLKKEAARAWLILGAHGPVEARPMALERSVRLSLEAEDVLAALFTSAQGKMTAEVEVFEEVALEARRRLGLALDLQKLDPVLRLELAAEYLREGRLEEATPVLAALHSLRADLSRADFLRLAKLRAEHAFALAGLDSALDVLRDARWEIEERDDRQPLDVAAAGLLERARRYDRAFLAYEGIY